VLLNIQGLKYEKMQFIKDEFKICKNGTLMAITETWLKKDVCNAEFLHQFENHDIVRCDFIKTIPDEPTVYGMSRGANSNSLVDQIAMMCHHF